MTAQNLGQHIPEAAQASDDLEGCGRYQQGQWSLRVRAVKVYRATGNWIHQNQQVQEGASQQQINTPKGHNRRKFNLKEENKSPATGNPITFPQLQESCKLEKQQVLFLLPPPKPFSRSEVLSEGRQFHHAKCYVKNQNKRTIRNCIYAVNLRDTKPFQNIKVNNH